MRKLRSVVGPGEAEAAAKPGSHTVLLATKQRDPPSYVGDFHIQIYALKLVGRLNVSQEKIL